MFQFSSIPVSTHKQTIKINNKSHYINIHNCTPLKMSEYGKKMIGSKYAKDYRVFITKKDRIISPFHDIPLFYNDNTVNVINEISRFENAKFEVNKMEKFNPITQDCKKEKLRFVANIFPSRGYPWNYGAIPQTWENPHVKDKDTQCFGDDDPLDVIDISNVNKSVGDVYAAKVLGCLGLIDDGECDWKIIVIDLKDENARHLNDIDDLKTHYPGLQTVTYNWFRNYKIPDGKPPNKFLDGGELKDRKFALKIIHECHESWKNLINGNIKSSISCHSATMNESTDWEKDTLSAEQNKEQPVPDSLGGFFYVKE